MANLMIDGVKADVSHGNRKLVGQYMIWNLPHKITCPGRTALCEKVCYAKKAEVAYKDVYPSRMRNLEASRKDGFIEAIDKHIKRNASKRPFFRIHESGDFYNQEYLNKWIQIANLNPDVHFLAFTKSFKLDYSNAPANLQIIYSVMEDTVQESIPEGFKAFAGDCQNIPINTLECPGYCATCGMCWQLSKIAFNVHFNVH